MQQPLTNTLIQNEIKNLVEQNAQLRFVIQRIVEDLPNKRDWLDPNLEREAIALLKKPTGQNNLCEDGRTGTGT